MTGRILASWRLATLSLALVVGLLAGCGGAAPAPQPSSSPSSSPAAEKKTEPSASQKPASSPAAEKEPVTMEEKLVAVNKMAPEARQAKLVEEAKKEGKVVLYVTAEIERLRALEQAFKAKYPFLAAEFTRVTTEEGIQKATAEGKAGRQLADVIHLPAVEYYELEKTGIIGKYQSPERKAFNPAFIDKEGNWSAAAAVLEVVGYNKDMVKAADAPKSLQDLLDPKWKGKLGRTRHGGRWLAATMQIMGEDKALEYAQKLAQQDVTVSESNSQLTQFVGSGEVSVCFDIHASNLMTQIKKGAPIGIQITDPAYFQIDVVGVTKAAPHPYAAALLIDFLLSKEGQEIYAQFDWSGGRTDVKYPFADEIKSIKTMVTYSPDLVKDKYNDFQSKFESLFIRR